MKRMTGYGHGSSQLRLESVYYSGDRVQPRAQRRSTRRGERVDATEI